MKTIPPLIQKLRAKRYWPVAILVGLVVLAGVLAPRALPNGATSSVTQTSTADKNSDPWAYVPPALPEGPDARSMLLRLALGTMLVLGLCAGTLWFGKRFFQVKIKPVAGDRQLRVVEALSLNHRCMVYLIQAGNRQLLAGVDGSGLRTLVPWSEPFEQSLVETGDAEAGMADAGSARV